MSEEIDAIFERRKSATDARAAADAEVVAELHAKMTAFDDHVLEVILPALREVAEAAQRNGVDVRVVPDRDMPESPGTTKPGRVSGSISLDLPGSQAESQLSFSTNVQGQRPLVIVTGAGVTTRDRKAIGYDDLDDLTREKVVEHGTAALADAYDPNRRAPR